MGRSKTLRQCYALQDLVFNAANERGIQKPDLAKLALAWERLIERQRILRGKPLPGSLRPSSGKVRGRGRSLIIGPSMGPDGGDNAPETPASEQFKAESPEAGEALG